MLVVPGELCLEQGVGVFIVGNFFVSQQAGKSLLEGIEAALDFAFGGRVRSDAMGGAQGGESALKLGMSIEAISRSAMTKERKAIGVEAGWRAMGFERPTQVGEMVPSGVAADEGTGDDLAGMIVQGEDEHLVMVCGPPGMGRAVVLPEFTDSPGLPTAPGFGAAFGRRSSLRKVLTHVSGDGSAGTTEVMAAGQFIGQESEIKRLAMRQELRKKIVSGLRPSCFVVATGGGQFEPRAVSEPLMA